MRTRNCPSRDIENAHRPMGQSAGQQPSGRKKLTLIIIPSPSPPFSNPILNNNLLYNWNRTLRQLSFFSLPLTLRKLRWQQRCDRQQHGL